IGGRIQRPPDVRFEQVVQARFEDRRFRAIERRDPIRIDVDARDLVPLVREARAGHEPHVASADNRDLHYASEASRLPESPSNDRRRPSSIVTCGSYRSSVRALVITGQRRYGLSTT